MTILDYVACFFTFSLFYIFRDILSKKCDGMIYKSFSGVENVIPILFTPMSQWATLHTQHTTFIIQADPSSPVDFHLVNFT